MTMDEKNQDKRDRRTLFLTNLPGNWNVRHIKALSKDIKRIRLTSPLSKIDDENMPLPYAYVSFDSEEAAEKNFKLLEGKLFNGTIISVDYVGSKSQFPTTRPKTEPEESDPLRVYLRGLPGNATEDDIQKLFPEAIDIELPRRRKNNLLLGYGFVRFNDPALTSKYHDQGQDLVLHGKKVVVLYARQRKSWVKRWKHTQKGKKAKPTVEPQKKGVVKKPAQQESSSADDNDNYKKEKEQPVKTNAAAGKKQDKEGDSEEEEGKSNKRKRDNKEGPAAKKPKKAEDEEDNSEEEDSKSNKRKRDNKEGPAAKKPKKAGAVNGDEKITLYIGNLNKKTTKDDLSNLFSENSISVAAVRKPVNKNIAFVDLDDNDDLENALALNGTNLNNSSLIVKKARVQKEQNNQSVSSPGDRFNKGDDNSGGSFGRRGGDRGRGGPLVMAGEEVASTKLKEE